MTTLISTCDGSIDDVLLLKTVREYTPDNTGKWLGHQVRYWCEGCGYAHDIGVHKQGEPRYAGGPSWEWNGALNGSVVLSPSQLSRTYNWPREDTQPEEYAKCKAIYDAGGYDAVMNSKYGHRCHTFIGINGAPPGHIIYLSDCTNAAFRGRVLPLLPRKEWPDRGWAKIAVSSEN